VALVVPARIQGEVPQQLPVLAQDTNAQIGNEHAGAGESSTDPDAVQQFVVTKRDNPDDVDLSVVPGTGRGRRVAVGTDVVVVGTEPVELSLQLHDRCYRVVLGKPVLSV
jgi:hypothetical protein